MVRKTHPTKTLLVPKLLFGNPLGSKALLCSSKIDEDAQAGAWEREPNPPYPPLEKGGKIPLFFKSPFFKGGFRGIIKMIPF
jgi:hypothetical protein